MLEIDTIDQSLLSHAIFPVMDQIYSLAIVSELKSVDNPPFLFILTYTADVSVL